MKFFFFINPSMYLLEKVVDSEALNHTTMSDLKAFVNSHMTLTSLLQWSRKPQNANALRQGFTLQRWDFSSGEKHTLYQWCFTLYV